MNRFIIMWSNAQQRSEGDRRYYNIYIYIGYTIYGHRTYIYIYIYSTIAETLEISYTIFPSNEAIF